MLLAVDGAAGLSGILANVLTLVVRHHTVGTGCRFVLVNVGFAGSEAGRFGAGELAAGYALADMPPFVGLTGVGAGRSRLGGSGACGGERTAGRK